MFFKAKAQPQNPQRIMEIGPSALIDLNQISAVYRKGSSLVIRIGGMGVIDLDESQLYGSASKVYQKISEALGIKK